MEYAAEPNLLLETLSYLGRKASGKTWTDTQNSIQRRKITVTEEFQCIFDELTALTAQLDRKLTLSEETLTFFFANLEGMPHNTIGSGSMAFLLFYSFLEKYDGNLTHLKEEALSLTPSQTAFHIAQALDFTDSCEDVNEYDPQLFLEQVLSQAYPEHTKLCIMDCYARHHKLMEEACDFILPVLKAVTAIKTSLISVTDLLTKDVSLAGCEAFLTQISHLKPAEGSSYLLRPFIFGMDTNLSSDIAPGRVCIYCGILRKSLLEMLDGQSSVSNTVYEAFRVLGDKTRFDMLCYLKDHPTYSQDLAARFNLSRNTIHHHMSKLIATNLVKCTIDGNRIYYSLDTETWELLLKDQRSLFL